MMASWAGIPTLIQEQNSYCRCITNKFLAERQPEYAVAYPVWKAFSQKNNTCWGTRYERYYLCASETKALLREHFRTEWCLPKTYLWWEVALEQDLSTKASAQACYKLVRWQGYREWRWRTGKNDIDKATAIDRWARHWRVKAFDFICRWISRTRWRGCGGITRWRIVCFWALPGGKPAILVPFPYASEDHQTKNAMNLVESNAAIIVKDSETREKLVDCALDLLEDGTKTKGIANEYP